MSHKPTRGKLVFLRTNSERDAFEEKFQSKSPFSIVERSPWVGPARQIAIISTEHDEGGQFYNCAADYRMTHIGVITKGPKPATIGTRVVLHPVFQFPEGGVSSHDIRSHLSARFSRRFGNACDNEVDVADLPPKTLEATLKVISDFGEREQQAVRSTLDEFESLSVTADGQAGQILGLEQEATYAGLKLGGIHPRNVAALWEVPEGDSIGSFLDGFEKASLREDTMVQHDACTLPGWEQVDRSQLGAVAFEHEDARVEIIHANRTPLERVLGVDLIYFNQTFESLVLIQYKAMRDEGGEPRYRPDNQLKKEIDRMRKIEKLLGHPSPHNSIQFRLNDFPFYLKFCPKIVLDPSKPSLIKGMYHHLDHWELLEKSDVLNGPKGGRFLSFKNARRWLRNTEFIAMVQGGWIGSTGTDTSLLWNIVQKLLNSNHSVTVAAKIK